MPSLIMERGRQKLQDIMEDSLGRDLMNAGRFCFSCEQIFANRKCLEEHVCSAASFICSCGTEFAEYKDMLEHSTTHEPGHQVLDHETIRKRRIEKRREEEEQLKRLQTGEVVWKTPKLDSVPSASLPVKTSPQVPITSAHMPQIPMQSAQISQVPELYPSVSQASFLSNPVPSATDIKNIFAGVGAPTVDLWTLYQPVVLLQTVRIFNKKRPYTCGKCGQCFMTKTALISHHSSHVTDKVSGCIGCGLLLSSKKLVPRFHVCNSPNNATKFKLITARPLSHKGSPADTNRSRNPSAQGPHPASSLQLKSQNLTVASKGSQTPHITSTLQLKNLNIRTYSQSNQEHRVTPSVQFKSQIPSASMHFKSQNPSASMHFKSQNPSASMQFKSQNPSASMQFKSQNPRASMQFKSQNPSASVQFKSQNPSASKPYVPLPLKSQSPNPSASNQSSCRLPVTPSRQLKTLTNSGSDLLSKSMQTSSASNGFTCRVCHISFETAQLLQRHKCIKAQEFMAQHVRGGKQHHKLKRVTPVASSNPAQMNGERRFGVPASGIIKKNQVMAVGLDKGQGAVPVNGKTGVDMDDDCYIVESGPDKPAEMIYQVTSSVPIKT